MSYSNKEWLNQFKTTNNNINEINIKMLSTIENMEKENVIIFYFYLIIKTFYYKNN